MTDWGGRRFRIGLVSLEEYLYVIDCIIRVFRSFVLGADMLMR